MLPARLDGKVEDFGDLVKQTRYLVKGKRLFGVFVIGRTWKVRPENRVPGGPQTTNPTGKVDLYMDLKADQGVALSVKLEDEMGNEVNPADTNITWTAADPDGVLNFADNGDGTAKAEAVGTLGNATVSFVASLTSGRELTGDMLLSVVAGDAERAEIVAGTPYEVTPDEL